MLYKIVTGIALADALAFSMISIAETHEEGITRAGTVPPRPLAGGT